MKYGKPIVGVAPLWDEKKDSLWMLPGYMDGIECAGGIPVMLPLTADESVIKQYAEVFDGFLFSGGHDVSPSLYGEQKLPECGDVCALRDKMEMVLFEKAVSELDKPMFGICRGIQFVNAFHGGTLYQDLPSQKGIDHAQKPPYDTAFHNVDVLPDTLLFDIIGESNIAVNSYHHQAVNTLSPKLTAAGISEDGLVEAAYMPDRNFVLAVQWHPELCLENETSKKLFGRFVDVCRK